MTKKLIINRKYCINSTSKDTLSCYILSAIVFAIVVILVVNPGKYNSSIMQGLNLFIVAVLPGLFPFMFLTKLLTSLGVVKKLSLKLSPVTKFLFNTSGISGYVFIMSILSGYPIGAKLISDLYCANVITQSDAKKMCAFCTTSGPIFIIASVGAVMFGSVKVGVVLYFAHIISSVMCGIILSGRRKKTPLNTTNSPILHIPDNLLANTMTNTVESIFLVGAYITIFFLFADILTDIGILSGITTLLNKLLSAVGINNVSNGIISGILEVTRGCKLLSQNINLYSVCFACFGISFSGLSIILQSMSFLNKCKIKARYFIFVKCVHAIISFFVCMLICKITNLF